MVARIVERHRSLNYTPLEHVRVDCEMDIKLCSDHLLWILRAKITAFATFHSEKGLIWRFRHRFGELCYCVLTGLVIFILP